MSVRLAGLLPCPPAGGPGTSLPMRNGESKTRNHGRGPRVAEKVQRENPESLGHQFSRPPGKGNFVLTVKHLTDRATPSVGMCS